MSATIEQTSPLTRRVLAPNPGPMTLDGTNSYVISAPDAATIVVVDPGPLDEAHLSALMSLGRIELVLVTHRHSDHTAGSARLAELSGAPVRALDPGHCIGGEPLRDGELLEAAGVSIRVIATPGHTADSVCFHLPGDGAGGSVLTGDTILGRGSTVVAHPDSTLGDYLASLDQLAALGPALVLPGHGATLPSLVDICALYREHRMQRLDEVRAALARLGVDAQSQTSNVEELVEQVTAIVYPGVDAHVLPAAHAAVRAQLAHLAHLAHLASTAG